jgi:hypothetical protein
MPMVSALSALGLLATILLLTLAMAALSGRRWTLSRSLAAVAVGQVGLHGIFAVLMPFPAHGDAAAMPDMAMTQGPSMVVAHAVVALLIGAGISVNDSALDTYFRVASSLVLSGVSIVSPWRLAALIPMLVAVARVGPANRGQRFTRWQRPRVLTDRVVVQCLSRRGPPELALAS